jgi:DNA-binding NarL/FixJ family response regulator
MTLKPSEQRVYELVLQGRNNQDIALQLGIAEKTVKAHVTVILRQAKLKSRCELIVAYYQQKLQESAA